MTASQGRVVRTRVPGYVRYVDDLFLFADRRDELDLWRRLLRDRLGGELDLRLKHEDSPVLPCARHLDALGYRLRRTHIEPLPKTWRRLRRRLSDFVYGRGDLRTEAALRRSLAGAAGHWRFG
jgi:RNA-directed DNA polymerase